MRYPAYSEYEDSGVAWIGQKPRHWQVRRLKEHGRLIGGAGFPIDEQGIADEELPFYKVGDLKEAADGRHMAEAPHTISRETASRLRASVIPTNAVVYAKIGAALLLNRRRLTSVPCCIDNNMTAYVPDTDQLDVLWVYHWLTKINFAEFTNPGAVPSFSEGYQGILPICVPPMKEQQQIAAFLDWKTGQIDALIARKKELLEKLKEKRIAVITQAVTQGLNPAAPMRDSGIPWLGQVPEHWEVRRLKFTASEPLQYGANEAAELDDPDCPRYIRITDIKEDGTLHEDTFRSLPPEVAEPYLLKDGDLLLARSGATVGKTFQYLQTWGKAAYAGYLIRFRVDPTVVLARFGYYFLRSQFYWACINSSLIQATIQNFSAEKYAGINVPLPPMKEQDAIVAELEKQKAKIDKLEDATSQAIDRLTEYRSALITATTTGKIDVRKMKIPACV